MKSDRIKLTFLGESTTGKTSIAHRLVTDRFSEIYENTIGASFMPLRLNDLAYDIWDTAGQERYMSLVQLYYRDTDVFLLVFDVTQLTTLERINYYIDKIQNDVANEFKILIIGNKIDLSQELEINVINKMVINKIKKSKK